MKVNVIFVFILLLTVTLESRGQNRTGNDGIITVDVRKSYTAKKELILQDFMDVEYIKLETNDEFVNQGFVRTIGNKFILVTNNTGDGDIFVYDRTGKALRKINRRGQGGEEYTNIYTITLDEDNGEMFVSDNMTRKILVYDLYGKFKRSFKHRASNFNDGGINRTSFYTDVYNFDRDNLICYDAVNEKVAFVLISKKDGSITKEIITPFKEKKKFFITVSRDAATGNENVVTPGYYRAITPHYGAWILSEFSTDTVYTFSQDYSLRPLIVRTPKIQSMKPEIFLLPRLMTKRYYFMETVKMELLPEGGFPRIFLMYDTQEKALSGYTLYNGDFTAKNEIYVNLASPVNHEIIAWYPLEAFKLVESYKKGELKGKLKDIAAKLDEEDNRVIMLIKQKK